jgi:hypothetical protein
MTSLRGHIVVSIIMPRPEVPAPRKAAKKRALPVGLCNISVRGRYGFSTRAHRHFSLLHPVHALPGRGIDPRFFCCIVVSARTNLAARGHYGFNARLHSPTDAVARAGGDAHPRPNIRAPEIGRAHQGLRGNDPVCSTSPVAAMAEKAKLSSVSVTIMKW